MKSKKLHLNELKIKSFVTDLDKQGAETVKGGLFSFIICNGDDPQPTEVCTIGCENITNAPCLPSSTVSTHNPE